MAKLGPQILALLLLLLVVSASAARHSAKLEVVRVPTADEKPNTSGGGSKPEVSLIVPIRIPPIHIPPIPFPRIPPIPVPPSSAGQQLPKPHD